MTELTTKPNSQDEFRTQCSAALTPRSGRVVVKGLTSAVEVIRDKWGVPHIYADTTKDLFFAQGFVAAQDRLWQMEMWRRTGSGRLSEILGPTYIERDRLARLIRYRGDETAEWESYGPDAQLIFESFIGGINSYIDTYQDSLPVEFQLLGIHPRPWTTDVFLSRMTGIEMARNAVSEVLRGLLIRTVGKERASRLVWTNPQHELEVPEALDLVDLDLKIVQGLLALRVSPSLQSTEGSNSWAVDGTRTVTGKPLLANDPHRALTLPSLRYLVHLVAPGWNVIGAGEPWMPGVVAGHNEQIGFGFTVNRMDQQDIYVEELNPADPNQYCHKSQWEDMKVENETIEVRGRGPVQLDLRFTRHGPVIHEDRQSNRAFVLRSITSEPGTGGYLSAITVDRATNWAEFLDALRGWKAPSLNWVFADTDGDIGLQTAGLSPVRTGWSGLLPVPGADGKYEWQGFLPLTDLPVIYNPPNHIIATANNNPDSDGGRLGFDFEPPQRVRRINDVLEDRERIAINDFIGLQLDEYSIAAKELIDLTEHLATGDQDLRGFVNRLRHWDAVLSSSSSAAAIYEMWLEELVDSVLRPLAPVDIWPLLDDYFARANTLAALKEPDSIVFGSDPEVRRDQVLAETLAAAVDKLRTTLGPDPDKWKWGDLHAVAFKHPLSVDDVTRTAFDLERVPRGGDWSTVNLSVGPAFRQAIGPSFRMILDLSDWDNSLAMNAPGQSGQPQSVHYADLLPLWAEGKYFPLLFSRKKIEDHTHSRLLLAPK